MFLGTWRIPLKRGFIYLSQVVDPEATAIWRQGWFTADRIGFFNDEAQHLEDYVSDLQISHA
jgi:hypothetical protein